jgi:hypothetical protein
MFLPPVVYVCAERAIVVLKPQHNFTKGVGLAIMQMAPCMMSYMHMIWRYLQKKLYPLRKVEESPYL